MKLIKAFIALGLLVIGTAALMGIVFGSPKGNADEGRNGHLSDAEKSGSGSFPKLHNSPGTECDPGVQCSDEDFRIQVALLKDRWTVTPQPIQKKCADSQTAPELVHCVLAETVPWLNAHPGEKAVWLPGN